MRNSENMQFSVRQTDAAEHQAISTQRLHGVDAHAAHHLLDLVPPRGHQIDKPPAPLVNIQPLDQLRSLGVIPQLHSPVWQLLHR